MPRMRSVLFCIRTLSYESTGKRLRGGGSAARAHSATGGRVQPALDSGACLRYIPPPSSAEMPSWS